jgi:shikimate kinase
MHGSRRKIRFKNIAMETANGHRKSLIFLTGFMGSGKSTIGPILANTLGYTFVDVDKFIERKTRKRIVDIFDSEGEQAFRALERKTLLELAGLERAVIALGGGTIVNEENYRLVSENGVVIYLKLSPEEIIQRVQYRTDRPMLKDAHGNLLTHEALEDRIIHLLARREQFYSRADVIIPADKLRIGAMIDEIVKQLRNVIGKE